MGTILNLINQGDALLGYSSVNWAKVLLTYCVPYLVCTYGAVSYKMRLAALAAPESGWRWENQEMPVPLFWMCRS